MIIIDQRYVKQNIYYMLTKGHVGVSILFPVEWIFRYFYAFLFLFFFSLNLARFNYMHSWVLQTATLISILILVDLLFGIMCWGMYVPLCSSYVRSMYPVSLCFGMWFVHSGRKVFLLVPPTKGNLLMFEEWASSKNQATNILLSLTVHIYVYILNC